MTAMATQTTPAAPETATTAMATPTSPVVPQASPISGDGTSAVPASSK
jgi:hypothetical protein